MPGAGENRGFYSPTLTAPLQSAGSNLLNAFDIVAAEPSSDKLFAVGPHTSYFLNAS